MVNSVLSQILIMACWIACLVRKVLVKWIKRIDEIFPENASVISELSTAQIDSLKKRGQELRIIIEFTLRKLKEKAPNKHGSVHRAITNSLVKNLFYVEKSLITDITAWKEITDTVLDTIINIELSLQERKSKSYTDEDQSILDASMSTGSEIFKLKNQISVVETKLKNLLAQIKLAEMQRIMDLR